MSVQENLFNNIYWLGGSSCSGKSSSAKRIAQKYNLNIYHTDEHAFGEHMFGLTNKESFPAIINYKNMILKGIDDFAIRNTKTSYEAFIAYCKEVFHLIIDDLKEIPENNITIVEGAHVFPELITQFTSKRKAIFLISTPQFQKEIWLKEMNSEIPGGNRYEIENYNTSKNKELIQEKHTNLHQLIAQHIKKTALDCKFPVIISDGRLSEKDIDKRIINHFGFG